jgi:hypothetical protein
LENEQMRLAVAAIIAALAAQPALAGEPDKPVTEKDVTARDVAATPVTDLNLSKGEIPPVLTNAIQQAYGLRGLSNCQEFAAAIGELDAVLGDDVDLPQTGERRTSGGRLAQSVVGSFIPFRGLIREVSGASNRDRELQSAVLAGVARRAFLKGAGQARGCRYPARSATLEVYNRRMAELTAEQQLPARAGKPEPRKSP